MLKTLSEVQALDLELDAVAAEREQTPPELIEARSRQQALLADLDQRRHELEALRRRLSANELELASLQERRKSAAESALRAGSAKEASQYQNQELQLATRLQELEDDTMPLLEEQETRQAGVEQLEAQLAALRPEVEPLEADEEARLAALEEQETRQAGVEELEGLLATVRPEVEALETDEQARLALLDERAQALSQQRDTLASAIQPVLLKQYEHVRRARRGLGVVPVNGGTCGGCNVRLPIFVVQKVRKGQGVTRCPSCGRLLWSPAD